MTRPALLISRQLPQSVMAAAEQSFAVTTRRSLAPMTQDETTACLQQFDAAIPTLGDQFSASAIADAKAVKCRILANFGVGYDHIDIDAARAAGIIVTNTPGAVTESTADIALMLMLMVARRAIEGDRLVRDGAWEGWHPTQLLGSALHGKIVGIVGMGRIGRAVARRCAGGFDMDVVFANRSRIAPGDVIGRQLDSPLEVAKLADFLVVTVSGGAATRHIIDETLLNSMKPNAILVNVARGSAVDEAALITALDTGRIGGAGLDVYAFEPDVPDALRAARNTVLLPHLGTAVREVREAMGRMSLDNLSAFFAGREPPNRLP